MRLTASIMFFASAILFLNAQESQKLVIIHTNDLHSRLTGFAPESEYSPMVKGDDKTVGGFARIASIIKSERDTNPENTLVIDGGDFLMGTLFHTVEAETGFQLPLMKKMGYDVVCLGNHEFDFGLDKITSIIKTSVSKGEIPAILLGNAVFSTEDDRDNQFAGLFDSEIIRRTTVLSRAGMKIGFFSLMGINAAEVAPFSEPLTFEKQSIFAKRAVALLEDMGCDMVICISHSGLSKDKDGNWTGEDAVLAEKVKGIDLIISGHTHSKLDKPLMVNGIPVVQAGEYGKEAGKLVLKRNGEVFEVESYALIPVDDRIAGVPSIHESIEAQKEVVSERILKPFDIKYNQVLAELSFPLECDQQGNLDNSNLGPLVADAIHYYVNRHSTKGADVSMVSAGVIRDRMVPGRQSAADIFRVMPLGSGKDNVPGYAFSRLYVTGRELKNIIEILLVAHRSNSDYYCFYSGVRAKVDHGKGLLRKVQSLEIIRPGKEPEAVSFSKKDKTLYSVTANSYMLEFIGIIKKKSFGLINVVPKDESGERVTDMKTAIVDIDEKRDGIQEGKEWLALTEFLTQMKDINANGIPDIDERYRSPVIVFEAVNKDK